MKIQIDTEQKTVKVENTVNLKELINNLKIMLPKGLWKEYSIETNTVINWGNPIYIEKPFWPHDTWKITPLIYDGKATNDDYTITTSHYNSYDSNGEYGNEYSCIGIGEKPGIYNVDFE